VRNIYEDLDLTFENGIYVNYVTDLTLGNKTSVVINRQRF